MSIRGIGENDSIFIRDNEVNSERGGLTNWGCKYALIENNRFTSFTGEMNVEGVDLANREHFEDANVDFLNNSITGFWDGIDLQGARLKSHIYNNIINASLGTGITSLFASLDPNIFSNNVVINSSYGYFLDAREAENVLNVVNNLFLNDSILISARPKSAKSGKNGTS